MAGVFCTKTNIHSGNNLTYFGNFVPKRIKKKVATNFSQIKKTKLQKIKSNYGIFLPKTCLRIIPLILRKEK